MNDIDQAIVQLLQLDGRMTNRALAEKVHLAPSTTLGHVRELERAGVLTGYHATVDLPAIGRPLQALIFVRIRPKTAKAIEDFMSAVMQIDAALSVHLITGVDDAVVHVAVRDTEELQDTVLSRLSNLPGVVDERTSIVFEHRVKHVIEPATA